MLLAGNPRKMQTHVEFSYYATRLHNRGRDEEIVVRQKKRKKRKTEREEEREKKDKRIKGAVASCAIARRNLFPEK